MVHNKLGKHNKSSTLEYSMIEAPKKNPPPKEISNLSYLYVLSKKQKKKNHIFFPHKVLFSFLKSACTFFFQWSYWKHKGFL